MESSKLVALLKQFDQKDWKEFHRFIESPYFNRRPKLIVLYQILKKAVPSMNLKKLNIIYINSKLFPNESLNEKRLIDLRNNLVKLVEKYWLLSKKGKPVEEFRALASTYHHKGFPNYRDYYFKKTYNQLENGRIDAEDYHDSLYKLSLAQHKITEEQGKRNLEPNLQDLHDNLDAYFLCTKLKYYCKVLNYQNFRSHNYEISLIDAVLEEVTKEKYLRYPYIQIYYHGVLMLLDINNENNFYALKNLIQHHTKTFSKDEMQNIFVLARNFCVKNYNRGKRKFSKDALDLYKIEIEAEILLEENIIANSSCWNIVKLALLQGEISWATNFLNRFKANISPELYSLSMANICFEQKKYKTVLKLLLKIDFKEALMEITARTLILKTYFQLCRTTSDFKYEDKLDAYLDSFNAFLKRKKEILTRGYLLYLNLVKFTQAINKLYWKPKLNKSKLAEIHQQIVATPKTAEWEWLKEVSKVET